MRSLALLLCLLAACPDGSIEPCPHVVLPAGPYLIADEVLAIGGRSYALEAAIAYGGMPPTSNEFVVGVRLMPLDALPLPDDLVFTEVAIVRADLEAWVVPVDAPVTADWTVVYCGPEWPPEDLYRIVAEVLAPGGVHGSVARNDVLPEPGPQ